MKRILMCGIAIAALTNCMPASAAPPRPLTIQFINRAPDVAGLWDENIRSEFVEAMNIVAANVSSRWLHGRPAIVSSDIRSKQRLIVVDQRLNYFGEAPAGYHWHDEKGPYAIFTLKQHRISVAQVFLDGSHELAEMMVDPSADRFINGWYAEVVDPVVCCHYDVTLSDGSVVPLNDFVLRPWFFKKATGPYDFIDSPYVLRPLQVGPGGFKQRR